MLALIIYTLQPLGFPIQTTLTQPNNSGLNRLLKPKLTLSSRIKR